MPINTSYSLDSEPPETIRSGGKQVKMAAVTATSADGATTSSNEPWANPLSKRFQSRIIVRLTAFSLMTEGDC